MSQLLRLLTRSLAVATALCALLPAAPAPGAASPPNPGRAPSPGPPPRSFFGTSFVTGSGYVPQFAQSDLDRFQAVRLGTLRMPFDWSALEPRRGAPRDWSGYDKTVSDVTATGTQILGLLYGSPSFAAPKPAYPPRSRANIARWRHFVHDVVARYGTTGTFWSEHPELAYRPVTTWQIWNEPNYKRFWYEHPRASQYARFLRQTSPVIRRADPAATIELGGFPNTVDSHGHITRRMEDYLTDLYRSSRRVRSYFDVVAIHPYYHDYRGVLGAIRRVRRVMRRFHDGRTPISITELGWATFKRSYNATGYKGQAKRMRQAFRALVRVRRRYRLKGIIWYSWRDLQPTTTKDWWGLHCGLFTRNDLPKPSWQVFRRFTLSTR